MKAISYTNKEQTQTMSSLEIAQLTGKRHDHVVRDIRVMIKAFEYAKEVSPNLGWHCEPAVYADKQGKDRMMYRLDKTTSITLLSGYDVVARHKIIIRWEQLEALQAATGMALRITALEATVIRMQNEIDALTTRNPRKQQLRLPTSPEAMLVQKHFQPALPGAASIWTVGQVLTYLTQAEQQPELNRYRIGKALTELAGPRRCIYQDNRSQWVYAVSLTA